MSGVCSIRIFLGCLDFTHVHIYLAFFIETPTFQSKFRCVRLVYILIETFTHVTLAARGSTLIVRIRRL